MKRFNIIIISILIINNWLFYINWEDNLQDWGLSDWAKDYAWQLQHQGEGESPYSQTSPRI